MSESDLISLRFLARVERSLLRRLSGDIRPHLLRFASHARSREEFMASAARLLVNPREREQWLASWIARTQAYAAVGQSDGLDTAPAPLDSAPMPFEADSSLPAPLDAPLHRSFYISPTQRQQLHDALARELGPGTASGLLDIEIRQADTAGELLARLQTHLDTDTQRLRFVNAAIATFDPEN